jgi:hypothetical protein
MTDFDGISVFQRRSARTYLFAVDKSSVTRIFVNNPNVIAVTINGGVKPRQTVVFKPKIGFAAATERHFFAFYRNLLRTFGCRECKDNFEHIR